MLGRFLSADICRVNSSASSRRSPRVSARIRAESAGVRRTFAGRSAESAERYFWRMSGGSARNRAESARIRADSRGFARIRGGSSSAEPIALLECKVEEIPAIFSKLIPQILDVS